MRWARRFLDSRPGRIVAILLLIAGAISIYQSLRHNLGPDDAVALSRRRLMICSQTLKGFEIDVKPGSRFPCYSPYSHADTGYPAERCYWTRDGQIKREPTPVLLNSRVGKPEPTFCPECGRLVLPHNPAPVPGQPPPTEKAWHDRRMGIDPEG